MSELRMENRRHASASKALNAPWRPMHYTLKSDACDPTLAENSRKVWKLKLNRTSRAGIPNGNATVKLRHLVVDQATRHHENPKHHQ